jgi:hypothetical protein
MSKVEINNMPGVGCKGEKTKKHVYSKAQRGFFYAVKSGKVKKDTTMTKKQATHHIEMGKKQKGKLPRYAR